MAEQRSYTGNFNNRWKFTGKELDEETGLYYYGARFYNPSTSIWLSVDPLTEMFPNWNPYNYVMQNPLNLTDPTGMSPEGGGDNNENPKKLSGPLTKSQRQTMDEINSNLKPFELPISHSDALNMMDEVVVIGKKNLKEPTKADLVLIQGLALAAHRLNKSPLYFDFKQYTEADKQEIFKTSAEKTIAIMMYEFGSGTRTQGREFGPDSAISENLKWSFSAFKAISSYLNSEMKENVTYSFYSAFSPDKTKSKWESLKSHLAASNDMSFYLGGMTYYMTRKGNVLHVKIKDAYTTASGLTRNESKPTFLKPYPITIEFTHVLTKF